MVSCVREKMYLSVEDIAELLDYQFRLHTGWWGKGYSGQVRTLCPLGTK